MNSEKVHKTGTCIKKLQYPLSGYTGVLVLDPHHRFTKQIVIPPFTYKHFIARREKNHNRSTIMALLFTLHIISSYTIHLILLNTIPLPIQKQWFEIPYVRL